MALKKIILNILYDQLTDPQTEGWIHKGQIEKEMMERGFMGDTTSRRLRELEAEGKIESKPYNGSKKYRYSGLVVKPSD